MTRRHTLIVTLFLLLSFAIFPYPAMAQNDKIPVVIMDFASKGGVSQDQMDALGDLLSTQISSMGPFKVISKNDIKAALQLENQRALLGCDDVSCVAELGGALGARWVVVGNASRFGQSYLMNLKILDAEQIKVTAAVARKVKGDQSDLIDILGEAVHDLFTKAAPATGHKPAEWKSRPMHPYALWGHVTLWTGVGCLAIGGIGAGLSVKYGQDYEGGDLDAESKSKTMAGVMWAGFGLGMALVTTGLVLWAMEPEDSSLMMGAAPTPEGGFVFGFSGRW